MTTQFEIHDGVILVDALVRGPLVQIGLHLALDTGASVTVIDAAVLESAGYVVDAGGERVELITADGRSFARRLSVAGFTALGAIAEDFPVVAKRLPPGLTADGFLGLDYLLRARRLELRFDRHEVVFES